MAKTKLTSKFSKEVYERNAEIYKILANAKRLEILNAICNREATVTQLSELLGVRKANTSQHLMVLRHLGLVKIRKSGKFVFYTLVDARLLEPTKLLNELHEKELK